MKAINGLLITTFMIWSIFFYEDVDLGFFRGLLVLFLSLFSFGIIYFLISSIPFVGLFSTPLIPLLFEWWDHDLWFGEFTAFAIYLAIFLFLSEAFIWFVVFKEEKRV
ncbi:MAG: hypothetical protein ACREBU_13390 [Nitrososphaera sp.]